jgi:hypothetical protein
MDHHHEEPKGNMDLSSSIHDSIPTTTFRSPPSLAPATVRTSGQRKPLTKS